jgi:alkylhydroperoxidase/carboxymuconolactone decarboxylase family protein YurZ
LNAACTNLNPDGRRRHIRTALEAGASRDEILMIFKMASAMSIHSCVRAAARFVSAICPGLRRAKRVRDVDRLHHGD